jgi:hypothetical protein
MNLLKKVLAVITLIFMALNFNVPAFADNKITTAENNKCDLTGKIFLLYDPNNKNRNPATETRKLLFKYDDKQGNYLIWYWGSIYENRSYFCNDGEISATGVGIVQYTGTYMPEKKQLLWNGYTYIEYDQSQNNTPQNNTPVNPQPKQ